VPPPPENVVVKRFDSTSIGISWTKFTLVELKGLAIYIVSYNIIIDSRKRQSDSSQLGGTMTVPWTQNHIIISGLQSGAEYNITVRASTAAGTSGMVVHAVMANLYVQGCMRPSVFRIPKLNKLFKLGALGFLLRCGSGGWPHLVLKRPNL
jgi:hypothetical protein